MAEEFTKIVVSRMVNAPVGTVWEYWSVAEQVQKWWGPDMFSCPMARLDFREGGTSVVCMESPQIGRYYSSWLYQKIVPLSRIEYIQNLTDEQGRRIEPASVGMPPDFPQEVAVVVTFEPVGSKTKLTITQSMPRTPILEFASVGLNQTMDKMVKAVESAQKE